MDDVPPAGVEAAFTLVAYYADMLAERRARRRPTTSPRRCSRPRSTATGSPTTRSSASCSSWWWPATRPPPSCSATPGTGRGATPTSGPSPSPTPTASPTGSRRRCATTRRARCWPASPPRTSSCTAPSIPAGRAGAAARRLGQPRRAGLRPTPTATTSTGPSASCSRSPASASAATSASAPRWPASRPASCLEELVARVADYDIDPDGIRRVHSRQRPRLRRPAHHGGGPLMPRFAAAPRAPAAVVTGASSGIGAATAQALAGGRPPGRARRPPARPARGDGRRDPRPPAARPSALPLDLTDDASIDAFAAAAEAELGPDRGRRVQRRRRAARPPRSAPTPTTFARQVQVNLLGAHRLVRAARPARWSSGSGATSCS